MTEASEKPATLPHKLVVTLRAGGAFFAIANVVCVAILAWAYLSVKLEPKALSVTGSARKAIVSDLVTWSGTVTTKDTKLVQAYDALKVASDKVRDFLVANGIPETNITLSAIITSRRYHQEIVPAPPASAGAPAAPAAVGIGAGQPAFFEQRGEEGLGQVFGVLRGIPASADVGIQGIPVGGAELFQRLLGLRRRAVSRRQHRAPVRRRELGRGSRS